MQGSGLDPPLPFQRYGPEPREPGDIGRVRFTAPGSSPGRPWPLHPAPPRPRRQRRSPYQPGASPPGFHPPTTCKGQRPDPWHQPPLHRIDPQGDHGDRHRIRTDNTAAAPTVSIGPSALPSMCTNGPGALPQAGIRRAFGPRDSASAPSLWPSSGNRPHRASHTVPSSISRMRYHLSLPHLQNDRLPGQAR